MVIRPDLVFTYWIFAWYLAYITKLTKYNPKWGLLLGIIENCISLLLVFFVFKAKITYTDFGLLIAIVIITKMLPFYTIYRTRTTTTKNDIYALFVLAIIYIIWVHVNNETVIKIYQKITQSIIHGNNDTPAMWFISKIRKLYL